MNRAPRQPANLPFGPGLGEALAGSEPLAGLLKRICESRARFDAVAHVLPAALREAVRPGPLDDSTWVLLVGNAAAAAKLRQLLPTVQEALRAAGWQGPDVKVKLQPRS